METPDGISHEDWGKVYELALEIVNAGDVQSEVHRSQLLGWLDRLEEKYGELPSILATRADYLRNDTDHQEQLLIRAYILASEMGDAENELHIAHSLAELYVDEIKNLPEARRWLECLKKHLEQIKDAYYLEEYERLSKAAQLFSRQDQS